LIPRGNRLVVGATSQHGTEDVHVIDRDAHLSLHREAINLMPMLAKGQILESWAGLRSMTSDGLPMIGYSSVSNIVIACGTYRNGWLLAPAIGNAISALLNDDLLKTVDLQPFSPQRFPI
jgi:glycine oxidase